MLEDKVAFLLEKYLGNYVKGLSKEALQISVWQGNVELTNMQLRPEALNDLKLPIKVKAGFLGSVKLKVPWSRLGQEPVLVYLDRIFLLAEPATKVEGCTDDSVQEAKRCKVKEMEMKLMKAKHDQKDQVNTSWLGSLINTIIGNIKLSISNIHIRYEDTESNPGHPFAVGMTLEKLAAVTVDDDGKETFITGGGLEHIQKSVELERLAVYFDSDIKPWEVDKPWEDLLPMEWSQIFESGVTVEQSTTRSTSSQEHSYILQPVHGSAKYAKLGSDDSRRADQAAQRALVNLDNVTLCLSQVEYRDILKLVENITAFNRRLKYAHYRPLVGVCKDAKAWWQYACKVLVEQQKKASGHLSWEQVLRYARLRKRYVSLYIACLQANPNVTSIDENEEIQKLDRELDIEVILQWRMLAHNFLEQRTGCDACLRKQQSQKRWWWFGWVGQSDRDDHELEPGNLSAEDWEQLSQIIGYKEGLQGCLVPNQGKLNVLHTVFEVHMHHNASKLVTMDGHSLTELSGKGLWCSMKLYPQTQIFDLKLASYCLSSPDGLLAESATEDDSLKATFAYMPLDRQVDWSLAARASPCYMTYLKASIDRIIHFFESSNAVSQTIALETAAAVQMTLNEVRRSAQQQLSKALKDRSRFSLDLDIAAPKITIPTDFCLDGTQKTKLLLDLGYFTFNTEDENQLKSLEAKEIYMQFKLGLKDISAFLVDGDYDWREKSHSKSTSMPPRQDNSGCLPVLDECGITMSLQQIRVPHPLYPSTRLSVRIPFLGFHFSPARYHRLLQVARIFQASENGEISDSVRPWDPSDFEGYISVLGWKGVGNREAVWQPRYAALVGQFLYILESHTAHSYKHRIRLRGKKVCIVPAEVVGDVEHVLAVCDAGQFNSKVAELVNTLVLRCDDEISRRNWQSRLQGAIYQASASAVVAGLDEIQTDQESATRESAEDNEAVEPAKREKIFLTGVLNELKVTFSSSHQGKQSLQKLLVGDENRLLEFRAVGSKVEFAMREYDMSIGAVLQSLEIEDAFGGTGSPSCQFLARSFIENSKNARGFMEPTLGGKRKHEKKIKRLYGNECFFDTSEDLVDSAEEFQFEDSRQCSETVSEYFDAESSLANEKLSRDPPSFRRIPGLLPNLEDRESSQALGHMGTLDNFVQAQVILFKQDSPVYANTDKQVMLSLATLSFFCNRPTILAILDFVNAINVDDSEEKGTDAFTTIIKREPTENDMKEDDSNALFDRRDSIVKGLLGRGKDRVIFSLVLSMARAQVVLNNENGTQLATLSQDNLSADIRVYPSSFGIKASLGNLKISDNSLDNGHPYFWMCDMRSPGGSSFVELEFLSFNPEDEDYEGFEYSLIGDLSEVRVVYLNRFMQEIVAYFMGLTPKDSQSVVKLKDIASNSEKWFTKSEVEGLPALKLDLSLRKPIIVMPRRTDSNDYLELDILHVTIQNSFQWLFGGKNEVGAVHVEVISLQVQDINLAVGVKGKPGESIIHDVNGISVVLRRSLRDLWHQIPNIELSIKIEELKAAVSDKEYHIITDCALSNISETPNSPPPLYNRVESASDNEIEQEVSEIPDIDRWEPSAVGAWTTIKIDVSINLVELSLHTGRSRDVPLATMQVSGVWVLFKASSSEESLIMATLKSFSVTDDREGIGQEFRRAIGKADNIEYAAFDWVCTDRHKTKEHQNRGLLKGSDCRPVITMLIVDAKLCRTSQKVSICIQRPQLLVALDFLLAIAEFFVPSIQSILSDGRGDNMTDMSSGIILDQPLYSQCHEEVIISPTRPLIADNERFDHFIYDGKGGSLRLVNRFGADLTERSQEPLVLIGNGKKLQFKNVFIQNGEYLDSCVFLGVNSCYSASEDDGVFLVRESKHFNNDSLMEGSSQDLSIRESNQDTNSVEETVIELQAIGPEFTFYNTSKGNGLLDSHSEKLLHAELDVFSRLVLKGNNVELNANAIGLTVEASSGIRVVEPFDTLLKFSKISGKTNIHIAISDLFTNFTFSILQLFIRLQEDTLAFLRMTSKKATVLCSQFDKIWSDQRDSVSQKYAFWRPQAPPGFAVLGDCLTPLDEPPSKGVLALNTSFAEVKRPLSFELIWSSSEYHYFSESQNFGGSQWDLNEPIVFRDSEHCHEQGECTVWMPIPPEGYVALGCVVSTGRVQPSLSSALCVSTALVTPCALKDCVFFSYPQVNIDNEEHAFWRVDNSMGSFLPRQPKNKHSKWKPYDLRHVVFGYNEEFSQPSRRRPIHDNNIKNNEQVMHLERTAAISSGRRYERVAQFKLIWWNRGSGSRKKLSIWRPIVPLGCVYLGDIASQGYEPPNSALVLHDPSDGALLRSPLDFQKVGQINRHRGMESISFWLPQAPPGYVSLGCIASKSLPKLDDFTSLRCIRNDLVTGDQFPDNSIWDTTEIKNVGECFSIWMLDNEAGTFIVRSGLKKPPKRFALNLADQNISNEPDDLVIDAEGQGFSATLFDDFGGVTVPLLNFALTGITFKLHGKSDYLNSTANFSLMTKSYNEKHDSWEPLIEPVDGFVRYHYDENASGAPSQVRVVSTRDLNMNVSVSNVNMLLEAIASWNKLNEIKGCSKNEEQILSNSSRRPVLDIKSKKMYYVIPQNKLGQDIYLHTVEFDGQPEVISLPSGDVIAVKVPASKSMLESHSKGSLRRSLTKLVTVVICDAELPEGDGIGGRQYMVAVRIVPQQLTSGEVHPQQQSARTRCMNPEQDSPPGIVRVHWDEVFYFKVDSVESYLMEIIVTDLARGVPVGLYSTSLAKAIFLNCNKSDASASKGGLDLAWRQLCPAEGRKNESKIREYLGKIRCVMFISSRHNDEMYVSKLSTGIKPGVIQISPTRDGPWTSVRLNYAVSAACWRMDDDLIATEVSIKEGNKCIVIRSLVSVFNSTDFTIELRLCLESSNQQHECIDGHNQEVEQQTADEDSTWDEIFENEKYHPLLGWGSTCPGHLLPSDPGHWSKRDGSYSSQDFPELQLPSGWEWTSDWHIDNTSSTSPEGWTYGFDFEHLKWPPPFDPEGPLTFVRRRRWIRTRHCTSKDGIQTISVGMLRPGDTAPLPVACLSCSGPKYFLQLKPHNLNDVDKHCWSQVLNYRGRTESARKCTCGSQIYVSSLVETEELIYCPVKDDGSSSHSIGLWFCLNIKATEIGEDIHLDPIKDWKLVFTAPLTLISFLPMSSEFSVFEKHSMGELTVCHRGVVQSGQTIKIYHADLRKPLYFSLIPQGGWKPIHDAVLISHPTREIARYLTLESSYSGRKVQVILEHNQDVKETIAKVLRIYTPYWLESARCPPLQYRVVGIEKAARSICKGRIAGQCSTLYGTNSGNEKIIEQINHEEIHTGCTIISTLDPKSVGLSVALSGCGNACFGPVAALSPISDADGTVDLKAHDGNGYNLRLFVSTKACPYQSSPTKVICIRPYMTFTNRFGQVLYIKLNSKDQPKTLNPFDWRVAYSVADAEEPDKLQVRLQDTKWSYPFAIEKEDTISVVMQQEDGRRQYLRAEIRGYEEGSRFLVVFRLGSASGPFRIENRTITKWIKYRQCGFDDEAWQLLKPLSTVNFAWENPYGQHLLDVIVEHADISCLLKFNIDKAGDYYPHEGTVDNGVWAHVIEIGDIKVVRFFDTERNFEGRLSDEKKVQAAKSVNAVIPIQMREPPNMAPLELILEVGIVGVSIVDQKPREILYLCLERVLVSYMTGYGGNTSRLKLLLGYLQLDNQLLSTNMPVLLAPELPIDVQHPVFKMTFTVLNENVNGIQVYPYVGIRVIQNYWRINVHEPIIWAVLDFYKKLHLDRLPGSSDVTQVDPEIRIDLIDVSEMRLKLSLETAPAQRPHGVLGMWSPIITAIGNVFKMQIHFRKVVHRDRFIRKSAVLPAIVNRIWRDLIHNPLHLIFGLDVLGITSSTLATLSKGFAELSTDRQFLQLRRKQDWSRRITGVGDGLLQGTEALAQGVVFGVSGVLTKPLASAREHGIVGFVHGLGRAFLGFIVQPVSGVLDFISLTVHGVGASCTSCFEIFENRTISQRIRIPRAIRGNGLLQDYDERAAFGQMVLHLAEAHRHLGFTQIFKEPSKFAWSDFYEEHFDIPHRRILLITNRRVLMVQRPSSNNMLTSPCKILWDVPWGELLALELAQGNHQKPSHVILHLRNFRKSESFVQVIKCFIDNEQEGESQATLIHALIQKLWRTYRSDQKRFDFWMLSSRQHMTSSSQLKSDITCDADSLSLADVESEGSSQCQAADISESSSKQMSLKFRSELNVDNKFRMHTINFHNIWTSEQDSKIQCIPCPKKASQDTECSIWRPVCPEGFISVGDIAHAGKHPPTVAAVYQNSRRGFASPLGFDLVWRNCSDDFIRRVSIWAPRAPEGYTSIGCVAVSGYVEPEPNSIFCVHSSLVEETFFEDGALWNAPENYPWACYLYQVHSEAMQFVALRQQKEVSNWRPRKVSEPNGHSL